MLKGLGGILNMLAAVVEERATPNDLDLELAEYHCARSIAIYCQMRALAGKSLPSKIRSLDGCSETASFTLPAALDTTSHKLPRRLTATIDHE